MNDKWSIQISNNLKIEFKKFCKKNGYKMSGLVERLILSQISGSVIHKQN